MNILPTVATIGFLASIVSSWLLIAKRPLHEFFIFLSTWVGLIVVIVVIGHVPSNQKFLNLDHALILMKGNYQPTDNILQAPPTYIYVTNMTPSETLNYFYKMEKSSLFDKVSGYIPVVNSLYYKTISQYGKAGESFVLLSIQYPIQNEAKVSIFDTSVFPSKYGNYPTEVEINYNFPKSSNEVNMLFLLFPLALAQFLIIYLGSKQVYKHFSKPKRKI